MLSTFLPSHALIFNMGLFKKPTAEKVHTQPAPKPTITPYSVEKKISLQDTYIKSCRVSQLSDFELIKQDLEYGHIIVVDMDEILCNQQIDIIDLKRSVERLRGFCIEKGGNMGRIGENYLVITPNANFVINN